MSTLKNLDVSTKSWDLILCFIIRRKLDQQSLAALENSADAPTEIPTLRSVLAARLHDGDPPISSQLFIFTFYFLLFL